MARPNVYGFSTERDFKRSARGTRIVEKLELRPKRGRRQRPGRARLIYVAITESSSGATWNAELAESTAEKITVHPFAPKAGAPGKTTIRKDRTMEVESELEVQITITSGKFKKAGVLNGKIIKVQCAEWSLPPDWDD